MRTMHWSRQSAFAVAAPLMLLLVPFAAIAAGGEASPSLVLEEKAYHFGKVRQGETIEHSFVVRNKGKGALRIGRVRPG